MNDNPCNNFVITHYQGIVEKMYELADIDILGKDCIFRQNIDTFDPAIDKEKIDLDNESNEYNDHTNTYISSDLTSVLVDEPNVNETKIIYTKTNNENLSSLTDRLVNIGDKAVKLDIQSNFRITEILLFVILSQVENDSYSQNGYYYLDIIKILNFYYQTIEKEITKSIERIYPLHFTGDNPTEIDINTAVEINRKIKRKRSSLKNNIIQKVMKTVGFFLYVLFKNKPKQLSYIDKTYTIWNEIELENSKMNEVFIVANEINNLKILPILDDESYIRISFILSYRDKTLKSTINKTYFVSVITSDKTDKNYLKLEQCKEKLIQDKPEMFQSSARSEDSDTRKRPYNHLTELTNIADQCNKVFS
jgi:hypothetical protein